MEEKKPNTTLRRERELKGWSQQRLAASIGTNEQVVSRWENGNHKPNKYFQTKLCQLFAKTALELGFMDEPQTNEEEEESWIDTDRDKDAGTPLLIPSSNIVTPIHTPSASPLLERLSWALTRPSSIDEKVIKYLEERTYVFWRDRHRVTLVSYDLMVYVLEHFEKVTSLLEGPLLSSTRRRLCTVASGAAQLLGELFFDMSDFHNEIEYKKIAITAAQEAENQALEAVAWGRMSFVWTYNNQPQEALKCIKNARRLAVSHASATVCAWLAAVEAEIQSILCNRKACLSTLNDAKYVEDLQQTSDDSYWLYFDRSLRAGYQGVCFQKLAQLEGSSANSFLTKAQKALKEALEFLHPAVIQRRATLLTDLAGTYVQQGEFEEAYRYAVQAIRTTIEIKSQTNVQRLLSLRQLEPWKDMQYVRDLDAYMTPLLTPGWYRA